MVASGNLKTLSLKCKKVQSPQGKFIFDINEWLTISRESLKDDVTAQEAIQRITPMKETNQIAERASKEKRPLSSMQTEPNIPKCSTVSQNQKYQQNMTKRYSKKSLFISLSMKSIEHNNNIL
ncbi:unnamed protein product [Rotaria magnacalcarata]|uniref:Uncharacterized protein n=1 Tax=Rotaria magnacalcarata TaxID=392030 RepID=A0A815N4R7_9BILA|nr:unnamed protein product [Rotaria magnacalcarata]CAF1445342.1 unnamed protein product [Rotaria magnacalcarata]CAF2186230.1 unnamed protein product [Rotaria magnacalcarata]CAF3786163.1 unnamed protein product [Rotaria magnacalcarata]CAF3814325.1 unnamed protein product [Rotaria magnacalcarata]